MLDINALGQVARVHAAALEVIDAVVGSNAVGGGYRLHASDNGLIGFLARVDIDAVAFGVVVVLKEREVEERVWCIVVAQVVERCALDIDAAHAFYQAVARRQHQHAAALPVGERRVALLHHGVLRAKIGVAHMRVVVVEDVFALVVRRVNVARLGKGSTVAIGIGQHATALTAHGEKVAITRAGVQASTTRLGAVVDLLIGAAADLQLANGSVGTLGVVDQIGGIGRIDAIVALYPLALALRHAQEVVASEKQLAVHPAGIELVVGTDDEHAPNGIEAIGAADALHPILHRRGEAGLFVIRVNRRDPQTEIALPVHQDGVARRYDDAKLILERIIELKVEVEQTSCRDAAHLVSLFV